MAYLFPSAGWVAQLEKEVNQSEAYASSARTWEGDFYFIIESGPGIEQPVKLYLDLWHGKCRQSYLASGKETKQPEFTIAGTLDTYRKIFTKAPRSYTVKAR